MPKKELTNEQLDYIKQWEEYEKAVKDYIKKLRDAGGHPQTEGSTPPPPPPPTPPGPQ